MGHIGQRIALVLLIGVIVISGLAGVTEPGRTALRTALFIPQVLPGMPMRFQEWLSRDPVRQEVRFSFGSGKEGVGDLYLPDAIGTLSQTSYSPRSQERDQTTRRGAVPPGDGPFCP